MLACDPASPDHNASLAVTIPLFTRSESGSNITKKLKTRLRTRIKGSNYISSNLSDPEAEPVELAVDGGGHGEVYRGLPLGLGLLLLVEVHVEVLVGIDAADLVEARRPNVAAHHQELLGAVARLRTVQLGVHEIHAQLEDRKGNQSSWPRFNRIKMRSWNDFVEILVSQRLILGELDCTVP